jgi:hypothetical protein
MAPGGGLRSGVARQLGRHDTSFRPLFLIVTNETAKIEPPNSHSGHTPGTPRGVSEPTNSLGA